RRRPAAGRRRAPPRRHFRGWLGRAGRHRRGRGRLQRSGRPIGDTGHAGGWRLGIFGAAERGDRSDPRPWRPARGARTLAARAAARRRPCPVRPHARGGEDGMTFEEARAQFPVFERFAYLNAGTNGPLPRAVVEAISESSRRDLEQGRGGKVYFEQVLGLRERAREALAAVLGVPSGNVALVSSTTNACNVVLAGLDLTEDDEIVTTDVEHFGLLGPLLASPARLRVARVR